MNDLVIIVPTRGRPENAAAVVEAWEVTGAFDVATLMFAYDADDSCATAYESVIWSNRKVRGYRYRDWHQMVPKLNGTAAQIMKEFPALYAIGFAGDDHIPRTHGWAEAYLDALRMMGTGIVYGDDRFQGANLPTQWAMTTDIVLTVGAMVPGGVGHLYCDNIIRDLGAMAGCLRYLPSVVIEHMHPLAGKAAMDAGYSRVNGADQYLADSARYAEWRITLAEDHAARIRDLRINAGEVWE